MTIKHIKNTFNSLAKKSDRKFKYKRCIKNSKKTIMFEVYHNEITVFNNFYGIKLLCFHKSKNIAILHCKREDIENINKYNLN